MPRVFVSFAIATFACLVGTSALGLASDQLGTGRHVVLSVFTLVLSCLLQVLVFTYFTISGKVVGQAVHLGGMDLAWLKRCRALKARITGSVGLMVASIVLVAATGGMSWRAGETSPWHQGAAALTLAAHVFVWTWQYSLVVEQGQVLSTVLAEYELRKQARRERTDE